MCAASPETMVVVDADTGYGNPLNVVRTVELWEPAGASGMFLEDQVWPKRCGHMAGKQVVERRSGWPSCAPRVDRRTHLYVTARTDARAAVGLDEALERARMARDLGVDAVFVEAPESVAELERIAAALPGVTLVANMVETGRTPLLTPAELADLGFTLIVSPLSGLFAMVKAVRRTRSTLLRGEGLAARRPRPAGDFDELHRAGRPGPAPRRSTTTESSVSSRAGDVGTLGADAHRRATSRAARATGVRQPGTDSPKVPPAERSRAIRVDRWGCGRVLAGRGNEVSGQRQASALVARR